jgi:hypothetical protein
MRSDENKYYLGLCDGYGRGGKYSEAFITWAFDGKRFSMCAEVWLPSKRDILMGGQCVEDVAAMFPENEKAQRMAAIWKRWHLNYMRAGSPAQHEWLRENPIDPAEYAYPKSHYDVVSAKLEAAGLNPDPGYIYNGKPYKYGHAWLMEEIPPRVANEIRSWSRP